MAGSKEQYQVPLTLEERLRDVPAEMLIQIIERRAKVKQKAADTLLEQWWKKYYQEHPEEILFRGIDDQILDIVSETLTKNGYFAFITINMDEQLYLHNMSDVFALIKKKPFKYILRWLAVFEYYTETGHHPHIHLILEKTPDSYTKVTRSKLIDDFYRRYKNYVSDQSKIDVKFPKNPASKVSYIKGIKKDLTKRMLVAKDVVYRKEIGIPDLFGSWEKEVSAGLVETSVPSGSSVNNKPPNLYKLMEDKIASDMWKLEELDEER